MLAPLLLAASLTAAAPAPDAAGPNRRVENATVVRVSPRSAAGSGVQAIYADFEVATRAGERLTLYVLWMGGNQYLPDVGAVWRSPIAASRSRQGTSPTTKRRASGTTTGPTMSCTS